MNKMLITMAAVLIMGIIWVLFEAIQATKRWIKKEREELLKDE